ncbi:ATP-binding protein [Chitinophaga deserti]|uniref:ATP-binding protein n=1 Tax=Chitinophaga deserti TaxID=2164099 RepID=UPI000D6C38D4|nr:ATP-binding protein [Chitinophaga deserti]
MQKRPFQNLTLLKRLAAALLCLLPLLSNAQTLPEIHRRNLTKIEHHKEDTALVKLLVDYAIDLQEVDDDTAMIVLDKALAISHKLKYDGQLGMINCARATSFINLGQFDSSRVYYRIALGYMIEDGNHTYAGISWTGIGNVELQTGRIDSAAHAFLNGLDYYRKAKDTFRLADGYNGLSIAFSQMGQLEKSLGYLKQADSLYMNKKDSMNHVKMLINMGDKYGRLGRPAEAAVSFREAIRISDLSRFQFGRFYSRVAVGELFANNKTHLDSALLFLRQAEEIAKSVNIPSLYISSMQVTFGLAHFEAGQYSIAREYLLRAEPALREVGHVQTLMQHFLLLTKVNMKLGLKNESLSALGNYIMYRDSVQKTDVTGKVNELETKYRMLEKDKSLADQQLAITKKDLEIRNKGMMMTGLAGGLLLVLALAAGLFIHFRQKQQLQLQEMRLMQKESELAMAKATMEGEEKERARIARNLHDGAGSILSGVKLYLSSLETQYSELTGSASYRNTLGLLNEAVTEIRDTSHNLMPKLLFEDGLDAAAHAYCDKLGRNNALEFEYQSYGEPMRFNSHFELMAYRMLQELLGNVIKHAEASHVMVQLNFSPDAFSMTVEDNGKGIGEPKEGTGIGLYSLKARAAAFRGTMEIDTSPDGTSIYLEFPIIPHTGPAAGSN